MRTVQLARGQVAHPAGYEQSQPALRGTGAALPAHLVCLAEEEDRPCGAMAPVHQRLSVAPGPHLGGVVPVLAYRSVGAHWPCCTAPCKRCHKSPRAVGRFTTSSTAPALEHAIRVQAVRLTPDPLRIALQCQDVVQRCLHILPDPRFLQQVGEVKQHVQDACSRSQSEESQPGRNGALSVLHVLQTHTLLGTAQQLAQCRPIPMVPCAAPRYGLSCHSHHSGVLPPAAAPACCRPAPRGKHSAARHPCSRTHEAMGRPQVRRCVRPRGPLEHERCGEGARGRGGQHPGQPAPYSQHTAGPGRRITQLLPDPCWLRQPGGLPALSLNGPLLATNEQLQTPAPCLSPDCTILRATDSSVLAGSASARMWWFSIRPPYT